MSEDKVVTEKKQNDRGKVGEGTAGKRLKALWHEAGAHGSFKSFVRSLSNNPDVSMWWASKRCENERARSDLNLKRVREERTATRAAKRKKKEGGK